MGAQDGGFDINKAIQLGREVDKRRPKPEMVRGRIVNTPTGAGKKSRRSWEIGTVVDGFKIIKIQGSRIMWEKKKNDGSSSYIVDRTDGGKSGTAIQRIIRTESHQEAERAMAS